MPIHTLVLIGGMVFANLNQYVEKGMHLKKFVPRNSSFIVYDMKVLYEFFKSSSPGGMLSGSFLIVGSPITSSTFGTLDV